MKPKFKMTKRELLAFNEECAEAALCCPQVDVDDAYIFSDRQILLKEVGPKEVVKYWKNAPILWDKGYHVELDDNALEWIEKYKNYKAELCLWKAKEKGNA